MSQVKITTGKNEQLRTPTGESLYVSFDRYSTEAVALIKEVKIRRWEPKNKRWETTIDCLDEVLEKFDGWKIDLGDIEKPEKAKPVQLVRMVHPADFKFKTKPFQHQVKSLEYARNKDKFLLGDCMGFGKSKQAIDIAVDRKEQYGLKHCLIVCGVNGIKWSWVNEVAMHSNETARILGINKKGDDVGSVAERLEDLKSIPEEYFWVTNIETLRNRDIQLEMNKLCKNGTIGMVVIDEFHKAKNGQSQQGASIHVLDTRFKLPMTGTPLMNDPLELYNLLKWIGEEKSSFYAFRNRYCIMGGYGGYEVIGYRRLDELNVRLSNCMLRRTAGLDLPGKIYSTEYVDMTSKQDIIYKEIKREIKSQIDKIRISPNPLAQLIRLRQATGWTGILSSKVNESAKIDRLIELVEEIIDNDKKVVVYSNWVQVVLPVAKALEKYNPIILHGELSDVEMKARKEKIKDAKVVIGTIGSMGTGINELIGYQNVIFIDEPWNDSTKEQAIDRLHRIGAKETVYVTTLVTKGTIDERINELVKSKGNLVEEIVDGKFDSKMKKDELLDFLLS